MDLISVIIPVFNGGKYLNKGLNTILQQSYRKIEVILINDGSTDDTDEIITNLLEKYQDSEIKIRYIVQTNRGIAAARNEGLEAASGDGIMFMDQDDWLEQDCVENLVKQMDETDADVVIGGFQLIDKTGGVEESWRLREDSGWSQYRITAPWGRLFRKRVIDKYHIRFMQTKISEDLYFNLLFFSYANIIKVAAYIGYNWFHNLSSESRAHWNIMSADRDPLVMLEELHSKMKRPNKLNKKYLTYFFTKYLVWYLLFTVCLSSQCDMAYMYGRCFDWLDKYYPLYRYGFSVAGGKPTGESVKVYLIVCICVQLHKAKLLRTVLWLYKSICRKERK